MSRSAVELIQRMQRHRLRIFTTADLTTLTGLNPSAAAQALRRLAAQELVLRIKRGLWVNRLVEQFHPYEAVRHLTAPWPAYVSLYSALADYGIVEEISHVVYAVSSNRPRRYATPLGHFDIHHLPEHLLWGYEIRRERQASYPIAEPEKAFLDLIYLALIPRSPIALPYKRGKRWRLDRNKLKRYAVRFHFQPLLGYLKKNHLL